MKKGIVFFVAVVLFVFSACTLVIGADVIKLKVAEFNPSTHPTSVLAQKFCEELNKRTNGRVELSFYPGGILLTAPKMFAGVTQGIADIGFSHIAYTRGRFPVTELFELPLGFPSSFVSGQSCNDFYNKFKPAEWNGVHVFHFYTTSPALVQTTSKPIRTLEDLKGVKIRATGLSSEVVKALGGTPVPIEMPDLYESLRRGVIEGATLDLSPLKYYKFADVIKYATASWRVGTQYIFYCVMNTNKWNSLPQDIKKIFTDTASELLEKQIVLWDQMGLETRDFFKSQGGQIIPVSDTEMVKWIKAVDPVIVAYKKDMVSKGYKEAEIDGWIGYIKERIEYWKNQEKEKGMPSVF
jgi:TRAP-type C4-dicarboxylate transport system substrate-binding protein